LEVLWRKIKESLMAKKRKGLYANIQAKRERIRKGSGETMRKVGAKGAPTNAAFKAAAKTAKPKKAKSKKPRTRRA
tara:strand:+ start:659 stop:886 length:228 start_codon:yes stop_codon:yes gene_type:complete